MSIELDMTVGERIYGIGYDWRKVTMAITQDDEPEVELDQITGETLEVANEK